MKMKKNRIYKVLTVTFLLIIAVLEGCQYERNQTNEKAALYVNQEMIGEEEIGTVLSGFRANIYSQYTNEEVNKSDFWTMEINGESPLEKIEDMTVEKIVYNRTLEKMSTERKITEAFAYKDLLESMNTQNEELENTRRKGGIIYGKQSYTIEEYYEYIYSDLEANLINYIIKNEISVTEKECKNYYAENKTNPDLEGDYEAVKSVVKRKIQDQKAEDMIEKEVEKTKVKKNKEKIDEVALSVLKEK